LVILQLWHEEHAPIRHPRLSAKTRRRTRRVQVLVRKRPGPIADRQDAGRARSLCSRTSLQIGSSADRRKAWQPPLPNQPSGSRNCSSSTLTEPRNISLRRGCRISRQLSPPLLIAPLDRKGELGLQHGTVFVTDFDCHLMAKGSRGGRPDCVFC